MSTVGVKEQPLPTYSEFNESQEDAIRLIPTAVRSRKPIGPLGAIGLLPHIEIADGLLAARPFVARGKQVARRPAQGLSSLFWSMSGLLATFAELEPCFPILLMSSIVASS